MKKLLIIILVAVLGATHLSAQSQWGENRQLEEANVIIEKDREIELPKANRRFEQAPPLPIKSDATENLRYDFKELSLRLATVDPQIRVFTIKEDPLDKLYGNYLKLGVGNYATTYAEYFTNNKRNERYSTGLHFKHLSSLVGPVDRRNSGTGTNELTVFGKAFTDPMTFSGSFQYHRDKYHFYGYDPNVEVSRDTIRQVFNGAVVSLGMKDNFKDSDISLKLDTDFRFLRDRFNAREGQFNANFDLGYQLSDVLSAGIESDLLVSQYSNIGSLNRSLFRIKPSFSFKIDELLSIKAGFNVVYENDTTSNNESVRFYPFAQASYQIANNIQLYGRVGGDVQANTLYSMVRENPYLKQNVDLLHTNKTLELAGGIKGSLLRNLAFDAGFSIGNYKNMYFFVNDKTDTTKFAIVYDEEGTNILNFYSELSLVPSESFRLGLRGDYFGYDTQKLAEAWHKPKYKLGLSGYYNIYNKIALSSDLYLLGGIKGLMGERTVELDKIIDLNIKMDYLFSERFAAFLSFNNIFSENYQLYLNYPTQGLLVMGGISYSF
jgi:hypothetical protein